MIQPVTPVELLPVISVHIHHELLIKSVIEEVTSKLVVVVRKEPRGCWSRPVSQTVKSLVRIYFHGVTDDSDRALSTISVEHVSDGLNKRHLDG
jgi:hypothetical protein